jgi:phytoene dehydrogenase-like protein
MEFDAVVIGSGPNGLSAAITLQQKGLSVLLLEGNSTIGGGLRTAELTLPGFHHDICSAIHPMAAASPFFQTLPLQEYGLQWIHPTLCAAHPFDGGKTAVLDRSLALTAGQLGEDGATYLDLVSPISKNFSLLVKDILGPMGFPMHGVGNFVSFGFKALQSAKSIASRFKTEEAKGLWAGMAAHSLQPLDNLVSAGIGLVLTAAGHMSGWPIPKGGSQNIALALLSHFKALGGKVQTDFYVKSFSRLPSAKVYLFDITPRQLLEIAGHKFSSIYQWQLKRYRYGMGVFKIDWALDDVVPFRSEECRSAGTVHLGNTFAEIQLSEELAWKGSHAEKPFVLLAQQSVFDKTRAPEGKHTAWAYCHVPNGSTEDMTQRIETQIERFAPGFRERILARHAFDTRKLQEYNPNYIGGDINAGAIDVTQLFTRPALRASPYRTSARGIYICSASTPPGGGVHGMCGYHAAARALRDEFGLKAHDL